MTARGVLLVVLSYFILFYFFILFFTQWCLDPNPYSEKQHWGQKKSSSSETSSGLGTTWRRQGVVLEASKCLGKLFPSLCIPSVYLIFVAVTEQGGGERGRRDYSK